MRIDETTRPSEADDRHDCARCDIAMDPTHYADEIAELGVDPAQAEEFLRILWDIMGRFVRLGIDVEICERMFDADEIGFAPGEEPSDSNLPQLTTEMPSGRKRDDP